METSRLQKTGCPQRYMAPSLRYGLRGLLLFVALCSIGFAILVSLSVVWSAALGFLALLIAGHIAGNVLGTKLRDSQAISKTIDRRRDFFCKQSTSDNIVLPDTDIPRRLQTRTRLRHASGFSVIGALCGAAAARLAFAAIDAGPPTLADWTVGMLSFAVIGGLAGFLASSFFQMAFGPTVMFYFRRRVH